MCSTNINNVCMSYTFLDLQLAAELGKTLLERNKDLENQMRQSQQVQYDQAREIDVSW